MFGIGNDGILVKVVVEILWVFDGLVRGFGFDVIFW